MVNSKNILKQQEAKNFSAKIVQRYFFPTAILLLAASVASIYLIFGKTYQSFRSGRDSLKVKEMELALSDAKQQLARLQRHAVELESIPKAERERMNIVLPTGPNELETLIQLDAFMKELNLPASNFRFSAGRTQVVKNDAGVGNAPGSDAYLIMSQTVSDGVDISFKATDYDLLKKVTAVIEKNLRLLDIESLTYNSAGGDINIRMTTRHLP